MPRLWCGRGEKETASVLDYSHFNLLNVPTDIYDHAATLQELFLDSNQLKDLPKALFTLQHLTYLNISDNEIVSLPPNVSNLCHLIEFDISKNGFLELPDSIKGLKAVERFDLSVNPLGRLPDGFTMLLNLTHVYLNDTFLDFLPANIGRMTKLEVLEVRDNHLTMLPKSMLKLANLKRLDIGNNEFSEMPEVIGSMCSLEELWVDGNKIKNLPSDLGNLKNLLFLDATENILEWVADELGDAESLTDLHLTTNNLIQLPETLCTLKKLETLKVDDNHLTYLPTSIGGLSNLEELIVNGNELETLPPGIGLLRKLKTLNADENYIEYLPEEIGSCVGLTVVSFRTNRLKFLPEDIGRLANLAVLNVSSNFLEHLPYSMMKLKKLKALWLSENQAKPLIPLQMEWDDASEKRYLTCYMFPQRSAGDSLHEEPSLADQKSFHASLFEEEWKKRTSVAFDLDDDTQEVVRLSRQPTPFPKEIRSKINKFREQAIAKGQVSGGHHLVDHMVPQHPYRPRDEVEGKVHPRAAVPSTLADGGSLTSSSSSSSICLNPQPYDRHRSPKHDGAVSAEELDLIEQLKSSALNPVVGRQTKSTADDVENPADKERQRMQDAFRKYQDELKKLSGSQIGAVGGAAGGSDPNTDVQALTTSPGGARKTFASSPGMPWRDVRHEGSCTPPERLHLPVDMQRNIKLSADSGLGSGDLLEESSQWKNGAASTPEQNELLRVSIKKNPLLGFSVAGGLGAPGNPSSPGDHGIFVTKVLADGPAKDILRPGDKVLEVNGVDFTAIQHQAAVSMLKTCTEIEMLVCRDRKT